MFLNILNIHSANIVYVILIIYKQRNSDYKQTTLLNFKLFQKDDGEKVKFLMYDYKKNLKSNRSELVSSFNFLLSICILNDIWFVNSSNFVTLSKIYVKLSHDNVILPLLGSCSSWHFSSSQQTQERSLFQFYLLPYTTHLVL